MAVFFSDFWRKTESFLNENLEYDFTKDQNSIWFLEKAREYGVSELVFFSNSAPEYLTKNGNAYGAKDENGISSNLPKENYKSITNWGRTAPELVSLEFVAHEDIVPAIVVCFASLNQTLKFQQKFRMRY